MIDKNVGPASPLRHSSPASPLKRTQKTADCAPSQRQLRCTSPRTEAVSCELPLLRCYGQVVRREAQTLKRVSQ